MLIILSEHASIYREKPMKNSSEKPMKKGLYSRCMLVRGSARRLAFRSFEGKARDQYRVQPFTLLTAEQKSYIDYSMNTVTKEMMNKSGGKNISNTSLKLMNLIQHQNEKKISMTKRSCLGSNQGQEKTGQ